MDSLKEVFKKDFSEVINFFDVFEQVEIWFNWVEFLQILFGNYVLVFLDDLIDDIVVEQLWGWFIVDECYNLVIFMCIKCKVYSILLWSGSMRKLFDSYYC